MQRLAMALALAFCILTIAADASEAQDENVPPSRKGPAHPGVSLQDMRALKPLALKDLRKDFSEGGARLSPQELRDEFRHCKFRKLPLGKLGTAVLMAYQDPSGGPNSGAYFVYLRRSGRYSKIAEGGGFGPHVLTGVNGIPDLAFGTTTGVCTENFVRLRYSGSRYKPDACMQNVRDGSPDGCHAEPCDDSRKLPIFPEPDPAAALH